MHVRYCSSSLLITSSDNNFEFIKNSTTLLPQKLATTTKRVDLRKELKYVKNAVEFKDSNTEQSTSYKISYKVIHFDYESNRENKTFTVYNNKQQMFCFNFRFNAYFLSVLFIIKICRDSIIYVPKITHDAAINI